MDLEAHGFVKRSTDKEFTILVKDGMDWRPDGPLARKHFGPWVREFADHAATKEGLDEDCIVEISQRKLSAKAFIEMKNEFDELSRKYASVSRLERQIHPADTLDYYSCLVFADKWTAPKWDVRPYGK